MRLSAGFLCVFTSCLPKLTLTTTTAGVRTGNQPQDGWQGCGDTEIQGAGSVRGPVSASTGEASLVVVYVIVCDVVSGAFISSMPFSILSVTLQPLPASPGSHLMVQYSRWGEGEGK